jgi:carbonic anhydrase
MKKLIHGVMDFRKYKIEQYRRDFAHLAKAQRPDALFIACSDSRVVPNVFASSDPGDLFVVRNVGNLVCPCSEHGQTTADVSEVAALEFSLLELEVSDIIVCGHSDCGAMKALLNLPVPDDAHHLGRWLEFGLPALKRFERRDHHADLGLSPVNQLSQINTLQQLEHLKTYPLVAKRIREGRLSLHAWWFDLSQADVYAFDFQVMQFRLIEDSFADRLLSRDNC